MPPEPHQLGASIGESIHDTGTSPVNMSQAPLLQGGPTDKERKYDRQLRLWAASGQAALESSNILLVNSGSGTVGVETLKNLVLPGTLQITSNCWNHGN